LVDTENDKDNQDSDFYKLAHIIVTYEFVKELVIQPCAGW